MNGKNTRHLHIAVPFLVTGLAIALLTAGLGAARMQAASLASNATHPEIRHITITSDLPLYPRAEGSAVSRTVYFGRPGVGTITATLNISGPPPLRLVTTPAFDEDEQVFTSTTSPLIQPVIHPVSEGRPEQGVKYSAVSGCETALTATVTITYVRDITPPTITVETPRLSVDPEFSVSWTAEDASSGVASLTVEYSSTDLDGWTDWITTTTAVSSSTFTAPYTDTTYHFRVTAEDYVGNRADAETQTYVGHSYVYLPAVAKEYSPFCNGDFSAGWACWQRDRGPFAAVGRGLPQNIDEYQKACVGDPEFKDGEIPVGHGYIAQTFSVPANKHFLKFDYRVWSRDVVWGESTEKYFDTFEVSIGRMPGDVRDDDRRENGCRAPSKLNPKGTLHVEREGLVFCGGQPPGSNVPSDDPDLGWRSVTLNLEQFAGQTVTLYVATWSREYEDPYSDNKAFYNTWSCVGDFVLGAQ